MFLQAIGRAFNENHVLQDIGKPCFCRLSERLSMRTMFMRVSSKAFHEIHVFVGYL